MGILNAQHFCRCTFELRKLTNCLMLLLFPFKPVKTSHISVIQFEAWLDTQIPFFDIHLLLFSRTQTAETKHATSLHTVCVWVTRTTTTIKCKCFTWLSSTSTQHRNVSSDSALPLHSSTQLYLYTALLSSTSTQHRNFALPAVLSYCHQSINPFITHCTCWSVHLYCWSPVPFEIILWTLKPQQQQALV